MVAASATLAAFLPVLIVTAIAICLDSEGPALLRQDRYGASGKIIRIFKFRSMYIELGDVTGICQTVQDDPRITRVGRVIRRFNIDELPQLLNVVIGDMSLVGPRCHAIGMLAAGVPYEELVPNYHRRHAMRPGLTGLAQMRGWRGPTDTAAKARARINSDLYYVDNFSIILDLYILVKTLRNEIVNPKGF